MKKNVFPFQLGIQYEIWEFDLLVSNEVIENGIFYDIYEYIGDHQELLGIQAARIELWFNFEVLEKVVYHFKGNLTNHFEQLFSDSGGQSIKLVYLEMEKVTLLKYERTT